MEELQKTEITEVKKRDPYWDIMKGIGALCIVLGHCAWGLAGKYVYTFHLALFFFVGGFLFKPEHAKDPWRYLGSRFKNLYGKYVLYSFIFILLHNVLLKLNLYSSSASAGKWAMQEYGINDFLTNLFQALLFGTNETLLEALWFVITLLMAMCIFCFIQFYLGKIKNKTVNIIVSWVVYIALAYVGTYIEMQNLQFTERTQCVIMLVPLVFLGYKFREHYDVLKKFVRWWAIIPFALLNHFALKWTGTNIDLSQNMIISPLWFYALSLSGIYVCLGLSQLINMIKPLRWAFSKMGEYSYEIMALHFTAFKAVIWLYDTLKGQKAFLKMDLPSFPTFMGDRLWYFYLPAGIILPIAVVAGLRALKRLIFRKRDLA